MLAPPDTPHRFDRSDVNDQAAVVLDRKGVAGVHDRGRARLFDRRRPGYGIAGAQVIALIDAIFEHVLNDCRIDLARLERGGATGAPLERGQARRIEREDDRQTQVQELHLHVRRRVAVGALVSGVELLA
jgi:hypothetical protein